MPAANPRLATRSLALALAAAALAGCAEEFPPGSVVLDQRHLALVAEPPELDGRDPAATVRVAAVEAAPPGFAPPAGLTRAWSFCPFTLGASTAYRCAIPQCELDLPADPDGAVTLRPVELAVQCLAGAGGSLPPELAGGALPETVEVVVRHRLLVPAAGGGTSVLREAVQRIPVWTVAPTRALNAAPAFASPAVRIGGVQAVPCQDLSQAGRSACPRHGPLPRDGFLLIEAGVTPASFETYPVGDRTATEALVVSFFTSAGRLSQERGAPAPASPTTLTDLKDERLVAPDGRAFVWAVLRDLRGGEAVAGPYLVDVPVRP